MLVIHAFRLDPVRGVFGVGHSSSIRCFRRPPNMVLLLFQRISQLARATT